mmetsp:Transcript_25141/g.36099  ORF Transcript_25141/g.36099 Transcript_25141/m.36099 type:complete len:435 (+) Transcript_25141:42-1346(+)
MWHENMLNHIIQFVGIFSITIMMLPLIGKLIGSTFLSPTTYTDSSLSYHIRNSTPLLITHISCITGVIPLIVDIFFDYYAKVSTISLAVRTNDQIVISLAFVLPSIIFVSFRTEEFMPQLYVALMYSKNLALLITVFNAVHKELQSKSQSLRHGLFLGIVLFTTAVITITFVFYFDWPNSILLVVLILQFLSLITMTTVFIFWIRAVASKQSVPIVRFDMLTIDEFTCLILFLPTILYGTANSLWNLICGDWRWQNRQENTLIFYMVVHFVFVVIVSTISGRIVRMIAMNNLKSLGLKQSFVRYVSHEIRSPLNVVHAGLDILRSELANSSSESIVTIPRRTLELINDIYSASETAIDILNDLLHYEHMDSGTFKLELSWRPLARLWDSKLKWAFILAEKSNISLSVTDLTVATEFGGLHNPMGRFDKKGEVEK